MGTVICGTFVGILMLSVYRQQVAELKQQSAGDNELQKLKKDLE